MMKEDKSANFAIGILIGVLGGVAAGVLLAPKEGKKTLKELKGAINTLKEKVSPEIQNAKEKALEIIESSKYRLEREYKRISENCKAKKLAEAKNKEHDIYCL